MIKLKIKYGNDQTDIRFPCTEKALQEALAEIDAEQVRPLELYVTEVYFPKNSPSWKTDSQIWMR